MESTYQVIMLVKTGGHMRLEWFIDDLIQGVCASLSSECFLSGVVCVISLVLECSRREASWSVLPAEVFWGRWAARDGLQE